MVDEIVERMPRGGRLIYVGAGTSGRIAAVDAAECESTFSMPAERVVAVVAGGAAASALEQEAAEDDAGAGARELGQLAPGPHDVVVGISASGRTPYVLGARPGRAGRRLADGRARLRAGVGARRARRSCDRGRRRARARRGIDAAEGRNRAEARAQHAFDRLDDPARQDVRQPDGRRRRDEREAARARALDRAGRNRRGGRSRRTRRSRPRAGARRSRSSRCSPGSTRPPRANGSRRPHDNVRAALQ